MIVFSTIRSAVFAVGRLIQPGSQRAVRDKREN